jgi:hypothetical protein
MILLSEFWADPKHRQRSEVRVSGDLKVDVSGQRAPTPNSKTKYAADTKVTPRKTSIFTNPDANQGLNTV